MEFKTSHDFHLVISMQTFLTNQLKLASLYNTEWNRMGVKVPIFCINPSVFQHVIGDPTHISWNLSERFHEIFVKFTNMVIQLVFRWSLRRFCWHFQTFTQHLSKQRHANKNNNPVPNESYIPMNWHNRYAKNISSSPCPFNDLKGIWRNGYLKSFWFWNRYHV